MKFKIMTGLIFLALLGFKAKASDVIAKKKKTEAKPFAACTLTNDSSLERFEFFNPFSLDAFVRIYLDNKAGFMDTPAQITLGSWINYRATLSVDGKSTTIQFSNGQSPSIGHFIQDDSNQNMACELLNN